MEEATSKREHILNAGLNLFAERGFDATTIPMIATKAEVGAGTIYRYFINKENLVNELFQQYVETCINILHEHYPETNSSPREQFRHIFNGMVRFTNEHEHALYFIKTHNHSHVLNETSRERFEEMLNFIRSFFEKGKEQGIIRDLPANALIAIVLGAFLELHKLVREGDVDPNAKLFEGVEESCWDAIRAH
ncbi:TetR family transcriptional regulator [Pontibacillus yanchengensis]|uniref:TetR family transcriptional regulator n=3 Tax=Pontibacillus yanchengensis TaxID=462910 RepID=A0ACC7VB68_9BACI|nr:TetR/AcrR family transcriptional regulator [Pontibacillus yanchengensis]MYL32025.1 TetR family transcriptional regulator [Pontibacillus yanchengensis]MYL52603.1 TetR family transcriptional regulator [Pontibacillus yanchengensis]